MQLSTLVSIFTLAVAASVSDADTGVDPAALAIAEEISPTFEKRGGGGGSDHSGHGSGNGASWYSSSHSSSYSVSFSKYVYSWCSALLQKNICYSCGSSSLGCNDACCRCGASTKITCNSC